MSETGKAVNNNVIEFPFLFIATTIYIVQSACHVLSLTLLSLSIDLPLLFVTCSAHTKSRTTTRTQINPDIALKVAIPNTAGLRNTTSKRGFSQPPSRDRPSGRHFPDRQRPPPKFFGVEIGNRLIRSLLAAPSSAPYIDDSAVWEAEIC
jgi:hypothetical protein